MVWRRDAKPVEYKAGIERIIRGAGFGNGRRAGCVQHWFRNAGIDFFAFDTMWLHGTAAYVWARTENRRDGAFVEHGQAGTDL